jgi:hypothetical protein
MLDDFKMIPSHKLLPTHFCIVALHIHFVTLKNSFLKKRLPNLRLQLDYQLFATIQQQKKPKAPPSASITHNP